MATEVPEDVVEFVERRSGGGRWRLPHLVFMNQLSTAWGALGQSLAPMAEFVPDDVVEFVEMRLGGLLTSLQARVLEDRWVQFTDAFEQARKPAPEKPSIKLSKDLRSFLEALVHRLEGGLVTLDEHLGWPALPDEALHGRNEAFDVFADLSTASSSTTSPSSPR